MMEAVVWREGFRPLREYFSRAPWLLPPPARVQGTWTIMTRMQYGGWAVVSEVEA